MKLLRIANRTPLWRAVLAAFVVLFAAQGVFPPNAAAHSSTSSESHGTGAFTSQEHFVSFSHNDRHDSDSIKLIADTSHDPATSHDHNVECCAEVCTAPFYFVGAYNLVGVPSAQRIRPLVAATPLFYFSHKLKRPPRLMPDTI
jgi:hypothetical protein